MGMDVPAPGITPLTCAGLGVWSSLEQPAKHAKLALIKVAAGPGWWQSAHPEPGASVSFSLFFFAADVNLAGKRECCCRRRGALARGAARSLCAGSMDMAPDCLKVDEVDALGAHALP